MIQTNEAPAITTATTRSTPGGALAKKLKKG
ncbi:UNVERIFIED_ORG: hypothetical protein GGD51_002493 [Rhizobium esperanzae]